MAQFPCLPLWTDAWIADTYTLSPTEEGLYIRLLILMWRTPGCRLPNDDAWLAKHLRITPAEVTNDLRPIVNQFCQTDGNFVCQKRLTREFVRRFEFGHRQSDRAKSRWRKKKNDAAHGNANGIATPSPSTHSDRPYARRESQPPVDNSTPTAQNQDQQPEGSLASAPDDRALARPPQTEPPQPKVAAEEEKQPKREKQPHELSLAEINARWHPQPSPKKGPPFT